MKPTADRDVLDPRSRHNRHVTARDDIDAVPPWSVEELYRAVVAADRQADDVVVILDYSRSNLYLVVSSAIEYEPPAMLGIGSPPVLQVIDPLRFDPEANAAVPHVSVLVAPEFDILVPAFDWDEITDDDVLPPITIRPTESPTGTGTPG